MADDQSLDQGKIKSAAENISTGNQAANTDANANTGTATNTGANADANTAKGIQQPAQDTNTQTARGAGGRFASKSITQGIAPPVQPLAATPQVQQPQQFTSEQITDSQKAELTRLYGPDLVTAEK